MKLFILAAVAALIPFTSQAQLEIRESGGRRAELYKCQRNDGKPEYYSLAIEVTKSNLTIRQSSRRARFALITKSIAKSKYTGAITNPDFQCEYRGKGGYTLEIVVKDSIVQVLQSAPAALYAPLQFEVTEDDDVSNEIRESGAMRGPGVSCQRSDRNPMQRYSISVSEDALEIKSLTDRFPTIEKNLEKVAFTSELESPDYSCERHGRPGHKGYVMRILVKGAQVQVIQSSINGFWEPVEFQTLN